MTELKPIEPTIEDLARKRISTAIRVLHHFILQGRAGTLSPDDHDSAHATMLVNLTDRERADLVHLLLPTFRPDMAENVVREGFKGAGWPAPLMMDDPMPEAKLWAEDANAHEVSAYAVACFSKMTAGKKRKFLAWAEKQIG